MSEGILAIFLNVMTIAVIAFFIANVSVSIVVSLLAQKFLAMQVQPRKVVLWLLVTTPWLASLCVSLLFLNGYLSSSILETDIEYVHWHHMNVFKWLSWHGITLMIGLFFSLYIVVNKLIQLRRHKHDLASLTALSIPFDEKVQEIEMPEVIAFTTGFSKKLCFISSGMIQELTHDELTVVIKHEKAHVKSNDPLKKWLFSLFSAFFISSLANRLKLHMTLAMEQLADDAVIDDELTSEFIASTLIKVARLNASYSPIKSNDLVANFGADVLEQRIYFLLGQLDLKPVNKSITGVLMLLILCMSLSSIDAIHHLIETVFNH
jgi:Zn-dependent protease with chaperone function